MKGRGAGASLRDDCPFAPARWEGGLKDPAPQGKADLEGHFPPTFHKVIDCAQYTVKAEQRSGLGPDSHPASDPCG